MTTETSIFTSEHSHSVPFLAVQESQPAYPDSEWSFTTLNYYQDVQPPFNVAASEPLSEHEQRVQRRTDDSPAISKVPVRIRNIKGHEADYSLETHGFAIGRLDCHMQDWNNTNELRRVYFPEVTELLKRETGAKHVFQFEWHVRSTTLEDGLKQDSTGAVDIKGPVRRVHIDESPAAAIKEFNHYVQPQAEDNKHLRGRPFGIYNVWKPLKTVRRDPLCLCDCRTVASEDLHGTKVCVPNMAESVFRIFDSRIDGVVDGKKSHGVAHSSFADPGTENEVARESVEVRNFCVF
ncbi:hypothetical protein B0A55_00182 [Friedmanniomyces simplex]|uniref:Uncharacterized protein n=1 Tax=Friedmanniomyces simplex TaxID=329884 RepID=A0A4U0Y6N3_9PEZI|nr:hypothetical protein B0A55_00182 [Friedmanniomyces simplex]